MKRVLVIGGTGTVGSHVVERLSQAGYQLTVLTTSAQKAAALPAGVKGHVGSLEYPDTLTEAFKGIDAVFMLNAHTQTEVYQGLVAISEAVKAGVKKFIYQSIHQTRAAGLDIDHFKSKVAIEDALISSGLNYVIVSPNNFYQNDFWFKQSITEARQYNQPIGGVGLSRVDVRDIADVVLKVLETDNYDGKTIALAGPDTLNGEQTARILSECLGHEVSYLGDDVEVFKTSLSPWIPAWMLEDWGEMYLHFQERGLIATPQEAQLLREVLGREPRSYKQFIQDHLNVFTA